MSRKRILLADDHRIVLDGLIRLLEADYEIVDAVEDGRSLVQRVAELQPDVIISDISMPGLNGIDALAEIRSHHELAKVIVLTMHNEPEYAVEVLKLGASGFVLKSAATTELQIAIRESLAGNVYITPMIAKDVIELMQSDRALGRNSELTDKQRDVVRLLAKGLSAKEVAKQIGVSRKTVEYHKYKAMDVLNIKTTAELIEYSVRNKLAGR